MNKKKLENKDLTEQIIRYYFNIFLLKPLVYTLKMYNFFIAEMIKNENNK